MFFVSKNFRAALNYHTKIKLSWQLPTFWNHLLLQNWKKPIRSHKLIAIIFYWHNTKILTAGWLGDCPCAVAGTKWLDGVFWAGAACGGGCSVAGGAWWFGCCCGGGCCCCWGGGTGWVGVGGFLGGLGGLGLTFLTNPVSFWKLSAACEKQNWQIISKIQHFAKDIEFFMVYCQLTVRFSLHQYMRYIHCSQCTAWKVNYYS